MTDNNIPNQQPNVPQPGQYPPAQGQYAPPQGYYAPHPGYIQVSNGVATASAVIGIIGFALLTGWYLLGLLAGMTTNFGLAIMVVSLVFLTFIALILGIIAVILGHVGMSKKYGGLNKRKAVTGLVTGYLTIAIFVIMIAIGSQNVAIMR